MDERLKSAELEPEIATAYASVFIPRYDRFPLQQIDGSYLQIKGTLTMDMVMAHLTPHKQVRPITLGAYALDQESNAHWICLDADDRDEWAKVWKLGINLHRQGITPYFESSRRGGHLWLFMSKIAGGDVRTFGQHLMSQYQIESVELFPKQDKLTDEVTVGSFVRLPFGLHNKTGKVYSMLTLDGKPLAPTIREQISILANPERVPLHFFKQILDEAKSQEELQPSNLQSKIQETTSGETLSERLKNSITVYNFVSQYVELDRQNRGHCPFHDDKHKSFQVNQNNNYWHCYADCGGGSIIDFAMKWREQNGEDSSFTSTIKHLTDILL